MKILLALRPGSQSLAARVAADAILAKALAARPNAAVGFLFPKFFDAAGPVLARLLALAEGERISFLRDVQVSAAELDAAEHLEVVCKVTVAQSPSDIKHTQAAYAADTLHPTASRWSVRLPQRLFLTKPVPAEAISQVDQWTGEYAMGERAVQLLRASGLTGYELRSLLYPRTQAAHQAAMHLVTQQLLPAALEDTTIFETSGTPRRYGLLSFAAGALDATSDFARTAEPWGPWQTPQWVVRQSARRWFADAKLRGWAFKPVLVEGSAPHQEHLQRWQGVLDAFAAGGRAEILA